MRIGVFVLIMLLSCITRLAAFPEYEGSIYSNNGLGGTAKWESNVTFSWNVTFEEAWDAWIYNYRLEVDKKPVKYVYLEVASSFTEDNILHGTTDYLTLEELGSNATPSLPESLYGIAFKPHRRTTDYHFTIVTDRAPVWGDFYAKGPKTRGEWNTVSNTGFDDPDTNPLAFLYPPSDGSLFGHILVPGFTPDDVIIGDDPIIVPEPATFCLLMMAMGMAVLKRYLR